MRDIKRKPLLDEPSMREFFAKLGCNPMHMNKLWREFLRDADCDFLSIPEFPRRIGQHLDDEFVRISSTVMSVQESADGTVKLLVQLQDGHEVETVIIDHTKRGDENSDGSAGRLTLCVSSQVGCAMKCGFCATGTLGLSGNLLAGEILEQFWHASQIRKGIKNVVFMGMGEPLENYDSVVAAIRGLTDPYRFGVGDGSITVSTVGVIPNMYRLMDDCPSVHLALSLHAPTQAIREAIVPSAKVWPLDKLMAAVDFYNHNHKFKGKKRGRVMMEYVVIKNLNDSTECAHELGKLLQSRKCMLNLIPFNPFDGNAFEEPTEEAVDAMLDIVSSYDVVTIKRKHHGRDIAGACGQLAKIVKDIEDDAKCGSAVGIDRDESKQSVTREARAGDSFDVSEWMQYNRKTVGVVATCVLCVGAGMLILSRRK